MPGLTTPAAEADSPFGPAEGEGLSTSVPDADSDTSQEGSVGTLESGALETAETLGEEYKPYSNFPWDQIPEEARKDFLGELKKFHGAMSRGSQEASVLRRQIPELKQKAEFLDRLVQDPGFLTWYRQQQAGGGAQTAAAPSAPDPTAKLSEYLDAEGQSALRVLIDQEIAHRIAPIQSQLENHSRTRASEQLDRELNHLREQAVQRGWPVPDDLTTDIASLIQSGRAATVTDAYHLVAKEDVLKAEVAQALKSHQKQLQHKADVTVPPAGGSLPPGVELFTGDDSTIQALRAARSELRRNGVSTPY